MTEIFISYHHQAENILISPQYLLLWDRVVNVNVCPCSCPLFSRLMSVVISDVLSVIPSCLSVTERNCHCHITWLNHFIPSSLSSVATLESVSKYVEVSLIYHLYISTWYF